MNYDTAQHQNCVNLLEVRYQLNSDRQFSHRICEAKIGHPTYTFRHACMDILASDEARIGKCVVRDVGLKRERAREVTWLRFASLTLTAACPIVEKIERVEYRMLRK